MPLTLRSAEAQTGSGRVSQCGPSVPSRSPGSAVPPPRRSPPRTAARLHLNSRSPQIHADVLRPNSGAGAFREVVSHLDKRLISAGAPYFPPTPPLLPPPIFFSFLSFFFFNREERGGKKLSVLCSVTAIKSSENAISFEKKP